MPLFRNPGGGGAEATSEWLLVAAQLGVRIQPFPVSRLQGPGWCWIRNIIEVWGRSQCGHWAAEECYCVIVMLRRHGAAGSWLLVAGRIVKRTSAVAHPPFVQYN